MAPNSCIKPQSSDPELFAASTKVVAQFMRIKNPQSYKSRPDTDFSARAVSVCYRASVQNVVTLTVMGLFFGFVLFIQQTFPQNPSKQKGISIEKLDQLYDMSFPRATTAFRRVNDEFAMDVRVSPSFGSPTQISIVKHHDGKYSFERSTMVNTSISFGEQVMEMIARGTPDDITELSRGIKVNRQPIFNSTELIPIIDRFFLNTRFRSSSVIMLDGCGYQVWYTDSATEVYFSHGGGERYMPGEFPLITWARTLIKKSGETRIAH